MDRAFDFTTSEILEWELKNIEEALHREEIGITEHAAFAAKDDGIRLFELLEAILVGTAVSKDLPNNDLGRVAGINYEHKVRDRRWIRVKVSWTRGYAIITAYVI